MAREVVSSLVHRVLLAAAGLVSVAGVVGISSATVQADGELKCKTGAVCFIEGIKGNCNEDVTNEVCCCESKTTCPAYEKCTDEPIIES